MLREETSEMHKTQSYPRLEVRMLFKSMLWAKANSPTHQEEHRSLERAKTHGVMLSNQPF